MITAAAPTAAPTAPAPRRPARAALRGLAGALALFALQACAWTTRVSLVRPAMLDTGAVGNTFTVAPFDGVEPTTAARAQALVQERIVRSLNRNHALVQLGGAVVIDGSVLASEAHERIERNDRTCSRSITVNGRSQSVNHPCTDLTRIATAHQAITLTVTAAANGQVLFTRTYDRNDTERRTGFMSPYEVREPGFIDHGAMLDFLTQRIVEDFSRVILPWRDSLEVEFDRCAGDQRCRQGFEAVQRSDLATAEALFDRVVGNLGTPGVPVPADQVERVSEALYNRGVVRGFLARYAEAAADLALANALRPGRERWQLMQQNIDNLAADAARLRQQGVVP